MITALDDEGSIYVSLLQSNSNSEIMMMLFTQFLMILDKKRKGWRSDTLIMLDNAPYHSSKEMMSYFK